MIRSLPHPGGPLGLALAAALALAACSAGTSTTAANVPNATSQVPTSAPASAPAPAPALNSAMPSSVTAAAAVTIQGFAFHDKALTVKLGQPVTWTNQDGAAHTVTFDAGGVDSGRLTTGAGFVHAFTTAGSFTYHCSIHTSMTGTITVTP